VRLFCLYLSLLFCVSAQQSSPIDPKFAPLAQRLLTAADDAARTALLAENPALANHDLIRTMDELGGQVFDRNDFEHALPMYRITCSVARQIGDRAGIADCTYQTGLTLVHLYRLDEAMSEYDQALEIYRSLNARGDIIQTLNAIGVALHNAGAMNDSLPYLEKAVEEAESLNDPIAIARSHLNRGNLYKDLGRYREALQSFQRSLDLIRNRPGMERRTAMVINNMGGAYYDQYETELAVESHQQAIAMKEAAHVDPSELATSVLNLGVDYERMGNHSQAISYLERAMQLAESGPNQRLRDLILYNYAVTLHSLKRNAEATEKLSRAIEIADRIRDQDLKAPAQVELAEIAVEDGRYADALPLAQAALDYARRENEPRTLSRADEVIAAALQALGRFQEAEASISEAIRATERQRAEIPAERQALARFMEGQLSTYQRMVDIQLDLHQPELALAYAERSKGRVLLDVLQSGGKPVTKSLSAGELKEEAARLSRILRVQEDVMALSRQPAPDHNRMAALDHQLEDARTQYRTYELSLYASHPELKVQRVAFDPAAPGELASTLPDADTAMLEYEMTDSGTCIFVVTRVGDGANVQALRLPVKKDALQRDVKRFREQIASRDLNYRALSASLYRQLIQPVRESLRGKRMLVIVPDGELWQLPFQALESAPGRYLIQDYAVFYTPSLSVLHEMQKLHQSHGQGNPTLLAVDAARLPAVSREISGLRDVYGASNVRIYAGSEADHDRVKREAPKYQILHLAAHGVFEDRHPMDSYLVLAKAGKPEAGMLQAREMMDMDLHADMVVLSGCETGRGSFGGGEGLIGMSWALFIAGAPATVASQWKVEAESTTDFMLDFHRNLRRTNKAKAIQQAALHVMQNPQFRHPFYWSGFVLMGEGF
jgi:CHAT domain-containing protein